MKFIMNSVCITGRLCEAPEIKKIQKEDKSISVCNFRIAVKRPDVKDTTDFFSCVAWSNIAEFIEKYFEKGQKIEIEGILTSSTYENSKGDKTTKVEILCDRVFFGESKKANEG